jgi:hypothetical protein
MRILSVQFDDEGGIVINYLIPGEQTRYENQTHTLYVTMAGQTQYSQVNYYANELREDAAELVAWWDKEKRDLDQH